MELPDGRVTAVLNSPMAGRRLGGVARGHHRAAPRRRGARPHQELPRHRDRERAGDHRREGRARLPLRPDQPRGREVLRPSRSTRSSARPPTTSCPRRRPIRSRRATTSCSASAARISTRSRRSTSRTTSMQLVSTRRRVIRGPNGEPQYLMGVVEDLTEQKRAEARIAHMARHDSLTDLPNRMLLMAKIDEALARLRQRGERFCVFLLDLDQFKSVNDSLGHSLGDVAAQDRGGAAADASSTKPTSWRGSAATSSRSCRRSRATRATPPSPLANRLLEVDHRALRARRPAGDDRHQHRHRARAGRRRRRRPAPDPRRPRALPGEVGRPQRLSLLRSRHGSRSAGAPRHRVRPARGRRARRVRAALPDHGRHRDAGTARRRSAGALASPAARPGQRRTSSSRSPRRPA